ncbi:MAG: hypothetical protein EBU08_19685 [Micrococcales bacterium]|nr:hypothetical protein [Micrococcales bacterium]
MKRPLSKDSRIGFEGEGAFNQLADASPLVTSQRSRETVIPVLLGLTDIAGLKGDQTVVDQDPHFHAKIRKSHYLFIHHRLSLS